MTASGDIAVEVVGLTKRYDSLTAVDHLDLDIGQGEVFGFLGPNGAGKTTTIRVLLDLIRPTAGRASVLGFDCQRQSLEVRRRTGYLPGDLNLYKGLTGGEVLEFFASLRPGEVEAVHLKELVDRLKLDPSKKVEAYSKGNRQKLGLIQALMHEPEVVMLDEPTSGLDPLVQHEVWLILEDVAASGRTVFFSSHVLSEGERICHRVGIIRDGGLVTVEEIDALKARALHIIEVTFGETVPEAAFAGLAVDVIQHDKNKVRLRVRDNLDAVIKLIARYPVLDLRTDQASLEEIFLAYYEDAPREEGALHASA